MRAKRKNKYTKYVKHNHISVFLNKCRTLGANVTHVTCTKQYYIVTYVHNFEIKGDVNAV